MKSSPLYKELYKQSFSQKWRYKSPFSNKKFELVQTYWDMKNMKEFCEEQRDFALKEYLSLYNEQKNYQLKTASDNTNLMTIELVITENEFIYKYNLGTEFEKEVDNPINVFRENEKLCFDELQYEYRNLPIFYGEKRIAVEYQKNVIFRYVNSNRTDSIDFVVFDYRLDKKPNIKKILRKYDEML